MDGPIIPRRRLITGGAALALFAQLNLDDTEAAKPRYVYDGGWGGTGTSNGRMDGPRGVAVSGDRVYVADSYNNRMQQFTRGGGR